MKNKSLFRIVQDIWSIKKRILLVCLASNIIHAIQPYIYIIFPAIILDQFLFSHNMMQIVLLSGVAVVLNAAVHFLIGWLDNLELEYADLCSMYEKNTITKQLMKTHFSVLDCAEYSKKIAQHRSETSARGGIFSECIFYWKTIITALIKVFISVLSLLQYWKVLRNASDSVGVISLLLGAVIIAGTLLSCVLLERTRSNINRTNRNVHDQYSAIHQIFDYYRDRLFDYNTGKEIRVFKMQRFIKQNATEHLLSQGVQLQKKIFFREGLVEIIGVLFSSLLALCVYLLIGYNTQSTLLTVGEMVFYVGVMINLTDTLCVLFSELGQAEDLRPRAERYYSVVDTVSSNFLGLGKVKGQEHVIEVRNVSFGYTQDALVLHDISLIINPGEKIAIVGENGSGKSTLVKLLCGLYIPLHGEILLDGISIQKYSSEEYSNLFSVVFQDYTLYSFPLGENIAVNDRYTSDQVLHALKKVGFEKAYDLESYLYKDCDQNGLEISGGESQKIALARALYKPNTSFVILDEPTAAMDPFSEMELFEHFNKLTDGKSTLFISHRLSSCRFCDKIIVLDNGHIIQNGTHEDLIKDSSGKYYTLWNAQAKYYT